MRGIYADALWARTCSATEIEDFAEGVVADGRTAAIGPHPPLHDLAAPGASSAAIVAATPSADLNSFFLYDSRPTMQMA
ncbi:hypothetical protein GCM10022284_64340 [Streptomyces hundungensis]